MIVRKNILLTLLCAGGAIAALAQTAAPVNKGIQFEQTLSWKQILDKAAAENKYILVDAYTTWCGPCKMMDQHTFSDSAAAAALKGKFIAVKFQMDTTAGDNDQVKKRYADAQALAKNYPITGYPCLLYFAPDGQLLYKDLGFRDTKQFAAVVDYATGPAVLTIPKFIAEYRIGKVDSVNLRGLAIYANKVLNNKQLADSMAKDHITWMNTKGAITEIQQEELEFIPAFLHLINTQDLHFKIIYDYKDIIDQAVGAGWCEAKYLEVIKRVYVRPHIFKDGKAIANPDWNLIETTLVANIPGFDTKKFISRYKVAYYEQGVKDMKAWANALTAYIALYPPAQGREASDELNNNAWNAFLNVNDTAVLASALKWAELCIKTNSGLDERDTRAHLLYKLGRVKEAIAAEEEVLKLSIEVSKQKDIPEEQLHIPGYRKNIELMKKRQPTYLERGALWADNTLPKK